MHTTDISVKGKRFTAAATSTACDLAQGDLKTTLLSITNVGTVPIYVVSGLPAAAPTADNTCAAIPAGQSLLMKKAPGHTHLYAIADSGTAAFQVQRAEV